MRKPLSRWGFGRNFNCHCQPVKRFAKHVETDLCETLNRKKSPLRNLPHERRIFRAKSCVKVRLRVWGFVTQACDTPAETNLLIPVGILDVSREPKSPQFELPR